MKYFTKPILMTLVLLLSAGSALSAPTKKELQERFKQRFSEIQQLKSKGVIGETDQGYIDFVKASEAGASRLVNAENDDRKALYELIAKEENASADVVAKRNAKRNFERAKSGEHLKENGKWRQKP
jgi:uncharacterized protein